MEKKPIAARPLADVRSSHPSTGKNDCCCSHGPDGVVHMKEAGDVPGHNAGEA